MALRQRRGDHGDLIHHPDLGLQALSIRYTDRLAEAGMETPVSSRGDSFDDAMAERAAGRVRGSVPWSLRWHAS